MGQPHQAPHYLYDPTAELLHQFITITGPGIAAGSDDPGHAMGQFWAQNAPRIGFSNPYVLHLAYSLAGYHLARGDSWDRTAQAHRLAVAKLNFTAGLAGLNKAISVMDSGTCGAIYISVMLLCFCTFAAGPVGRNDLLVCQVGVAQPKPSVPLARGAHLVRQRFDSATLFSGLMAPLAPTNSQPADSRATCHRQCFVRVDWMDQLSRLRELIVSSDTREVSVTIRSFDTLRAIYEATYGDRDGFYEGPPMHGMVLRWLYVMEDDFVASLQSKDAMALLILAYFAPLLNTMSKAWFLKGWAEHLLTSIRILIDKEYVEWLEWPIGVAEQYSEHIR
ncbi:C6 finger domain protein, partial [Metarhizium brunneum ARSEF 3297]